MSQNTPTVDFIAPQKQLDAYANVLINFALNSGLGVKPGEVVAIRISENAKPLLQALYQQVLKAGAHPLVLYQPTDLAKTFFDQATDQQLSFAPNEYYKGLIKQIDHYVVIRSEKNKRELSSIAPQKLVLNAQSTKKFMKLRQTKEHEHKLTWTLANYPTHSCASEASMTTQQYWDQIVSCCFLDKPDPLASWRTVFEQVQQIKDYLNSLDIRFVEVIGTNTHLRVGIGAHRQWLGGSGRNIPSFEVFVSPDYRQTSGHIQFTEPLYIYSTLVTDAYARFENGICVEVRASQGQAVLEEYMKIPHANRLGEFSLTDVRLSKITRFMADTLYDENVGGKYGNCHVAFGNAYVDSYAGPQKVSSLKKKDLDELGFNQSAVHTDIVDASPKEVYAIFGDGSRKLLYKDGTFVELSLKPID
jgi:aminopeptidase